MQSLQTLTLLLWISFVPAIQPNEPLSPRAQNCTDCHDGQADTPTYVSPHRALAESVHAQLDCTDCHASINLDQIDASSPRPHGDEVESVESDLCTECHEDDAESYQSHGRLKIGSDPDIPRCWDCHGTHDILPSSERRSHVHRVNLPSTCRACHTDVDLVTKHDVLRDAPIKLYQNSVHGRATSKGIYVAAICSDCHAAKSDDGTRTSHRILSAADSGSSIFHFAIPETCGQCHKSVTKDYLEGIHGELVLRGAVDSPVCTTCHGEHGIISPDDPGSPVSAARLAEETCAPCHESAVLNEKYGVPSGKLRKYVDTYHGLKAKAGDVHVANCSSCHGAHRILPSTDPTSSIHVDQLRKTCGECHPGISAELASTSIHEAVANGKMGWPGLITNIYYWIIGITIGLMSLHCLGDFVRHLRALQTKPFVIRMNTSETAQHWLLASSFIILVISGFSLRFSEAWWVQFMFGWGGGEGFLIRGLIHRIAAVLFIVYCAWHFIYLFTSRGRQWLRDMLVTPRDVGQIRHNALHFLGLRESQPRFGRFSYMEKIEYWALIWGALLMSATGILLALDNYFINAFGLPKSVLDIALVIHYYEAWLATLAIFVWHGYSTVFSPHVYPMNTAWLRGRMAKDMYAHEHPDGPKLKARTCTVRYEDEIEADATEKPASKGGKPLNVSGGECI